MTSTTPLSYFRPEGEYNLTSIRDLKKATADLAVVIETHPPLHGSTPG